MCPQISKSQHYLAKFYLKGFTSEGQLWVYDRQTNLYRRDKPHNVAFETHCYTFQNQDGTKDDSIERFFSLIESGAAPVITKLVEGKPITDDERERMALFAGYQAARVPDMRKAIDEGTGKMAKKLAKFNFFSPKRTAAILHEYEAETGQRARITPEELHKYIHEGEWTIKNDPAWILHLQFELGMKLAEILVQMSWVVMRAPTNTAFITTDVPFVLIPPKSYDPRYLLTRSFGVLNAGGRFLPLTSQVCLFFASRRGGVVLDRGITREQVRAYNSLLARRSDRLVIARDLPHLQHIVNRNRISEWRITERMHVG